MADQQLYSQPPSRSAFTTILHIMSAASAQNLEEAATIASEFIYSLDNLPSEVNHLLQEIKVKEARVQELQQEIDKDSSRYIRHSIRSTSSPNPNDSSNRAPSPKTVGIPAKIQTSYAEIQELSNEKCLLAQRLIDLITRTRARLDADIVKVKYLQGEVPEPTSTSLGKAGSGVALGGVDFGPSGRNPAQQISESLRNALTGASESRQGSATPVASAVTASSGGSATKKRRINASASIKITPVPSPTKHRSASPSAAAISQTTHQRSRLSRQIHPVEESEPEAGGDDDMDGEDDPEDERLYCFCQKQSYGDMVACDNEHGCPYEWFHLSCVGLKQPVPEKWFCAECLKNLGGGGQTVRKGRKK
ncbi:hypothetical protein NP233_g8426 [Leucocoprinus birnbaumii]|uniref:Chromatin modification-related protein n=1 Tax=Leucocoprinus birnbaumii TaxID=56174 RepID=A0AAD5YTV9_9AGAR|nr:hypothetical protein NP233_g8426 [Leucocoprinus birnbaumii]